MTARCPICCNDTFWEGNPWRPFCSERCQLIDLGAWVSEWYRMPGLPLTAPSELEEGGNIPNEPPDR